MLLYHGTSESAWLAIKEAGAILPRHGRKAKGNWAHTKANSHPRCVYLTDAYAGYFALQAIEGSADEGYERLAIIEVNAALLTDNLVPDEDVLEQTSRVPLVRIGNKEMLRRTAMYRGQMASYRGKPEGYTASLAAMGTCAHWGAIPLYAITRVALFDAREDAQWAWDNLQPTITPLNYKFCGEDYKELTQRAFSIGECIWPNVP
jgi:hypothetical protein